MSALVTQGKPLTGSRVRFLARQRKTTIAFVIGPCRSLPDSPCNHACVCGLSSRAEAECCLSIPAGSGQVSRRALRGKSRKRVLMCSTCARAM